MCTITRPAAGTVPGHRAVAGYGRGLGAALVLIGAYYLLQNLGLLGWARVDVLCPILLILLGVLMLIRRGRARNFDVVVVQTGAEAKSEVLRRIPDGARIHSGKSKTLEDIGLFDTLMGSDEYDFVRKHTMKLDRNTQRREMVKLGATPDLMVNSVQAVTEAGQLVVVSASGSQIGAISAGAETLILVVGSQKIVPNLDAAFQRIQEHVFPYEDARLLEMLGIHTAWTRTLILEREFTPGRTTVVLVRNPVGV